MNIPTLTIAFAALLLLIPVKPFSEVITFTSQDCDLFNVIENTAPGGKKYFTVADITYTRDTLPFVTDCTLAFNQASTALGKDDADHYRIRYASYGPVTGKGVHGGGGANFYKSDHRVEIETVKNLWLGTCEDLGSFTIELRFRPASLRDESILFSRVGFASGKKNGIEFVIKNGRLTARFWGVFKDDAGRPRNVFMNRGRRLAINKWHHAMISFDRVSGKLAKRLNGSEDEVVYVSESDQPFVSVYTPSFHCDDLPSAVIGRGFFGMIDEFRITYRHVGDLKKETEIAHKRYKKLKLTGREPINKEGVVTSPLYPLPSTGTMTTLFSWREELKKNTFVWLEYRTSDDLFDRNGPEPKWYRITNNQRNIYLMKTGTEWLRGKYCQWRAHLVPAPDGRHAPRLSDITHTYKIDNAPRPPLLVEVSQTGDRQVTLRWKKNVEPDICGYRIYYGLNAKKYDGILTYSRDRRITNRLGGDGTVAVTVTNHIVEENKNRDPRGILSYPLLKNNVLYFFSVTAYDTYRPDTKYNHESDFSKEVTGRPFPGSEINPD